MPHSFASLQAEWNALSDQEQIEMDKAVSYIIYSHCRGDFDLVYGLIANMYWRNRISWRNPLVSACVWRLWMCIQSPIPERALA